MAAVGGGSGGHSCLPCVWYVAVSATHAAWVFSIGPWILIGWKLLPESGNGSGNCWSAFLVGNLNLNGGRPKVYTPSYTKTMFWNPSCWNHSHPSHYGCHLPLTGVIIWGHQPKTMHYYKGKFQKWPYISASSFIPPKSVAFHKPLVLQVTNPTYFPIVTWHDPWPLLDQQLSRWLL